MTRDEFNKRYTVEQCPNGPGWYIADNVERCIAAGPWRDKGVADRSIVFMRAHCND